MSGGLLVAKGDKGDAYVITEADKQEIKEALSGDINELKGDLVNILNDEMPRNLVKGFYVNLNTGALEHDNEYTATGFIDVSGLDRIIFVNDKATIYNCFYDANKTKISNFAIGVGTVAIKIPTNAMYVVVSNTNANMESLKIWSKRKTQGKSLDDAFSLIEKIRLNEFPYKIVIQEYVNKANGQFLSDSEWARSEMINIENFASLVITTEKASNYNCFYDSEKNFISSFDLKVGENRISIPNNAQFIALSNEKDYMLSTKINSYLSQYMKDNSKDVSDSGNLVELSENLFDKSSSNIMRDSNIDNYGIVSDPGSSVSDFIPVIKGKRYTQIYVDEWNVLENGDYDMANLVSYSRNYVAFYDDDKAFIGTTNSEPYQAPLIPDRCKYIRVAYKTAKENQFMVVPDHISSPQVMCYSSYEESNVVEIAKERLNDSLINGIARLGYNVTGIDTPPQQTIESFDLACKYGFNVLLADCNFTLDNVPVCFHDTHIGSSYPDIPLNNDGSMIQNVDKSIGIYSKTYNEWVSGYDFGLYKGEKYRGTKLLTVEEFVRYCKFKGKRCYLEVKVELTNEQTEIIANILKKYNMEEHVTVATNTSSSNISAMVYLEELCHKLKRVAFMPQHLTENAKYAFSSVKKDGVEVVWFGWGEHNLTTEEVDYLIANNITYENGTYDTASAMIKWLNTAENKYCSGIESGRIPANIALSKKAYLLN